MSETIGTVRQPLVGGLEASLATQEEFGLVSLSDSCTGSLIRNGWVVAAAHCIEAGPPDRPVPDPDRPGQNVLRPLVGMQVTASWSGGQTRSVVQAETFRPWDVALLRLSDPIEVHGDINTYARLPYDVGGGQDVVGLTITLFGRGISRFATGSGSSAVPSQQDGKHRVAYAKVDQETEFAYGYSPMIGAFMAGGDSGGPSFVYSQGRYELLGVHSSAQVTCAPGQQCMAWTGPGAAPPSWTPWRWVTSTPKAFDAPVSMVWGQIQGFIGPAPAADALPQEPPGYIGVFSSAPVGRPNILYGIEGSGVLQWYRTGGATVTRGGPDAVGNGWNAFVDVIPAGGNSCYALTDDGRLTWYQHRGADTGAWDWSPEVEVGHGWAFHTIFAGGDGVVYAVTDEGRLWWYRHEGFRDGGTSWSAAKEVGTGAGWDRFTTVCGGGAGEIFAIDAAGTLTRYEHRGYADGSRVWGRTLRIGTGWDAYRHVVALGENRLLTVDPEGFATWRTYLGTRLAPRRPDEATLEREVHDWIDAPAGGGFHYPRMFGLLPETTLRGPA